MLIGIDASRALRAQRTGTEHYSLEIIQHLLALPETTQHRLRLYVDQAIPADSTLLRAIAAFEQQPTAQPVEICLLQARRLWTHLQLAREVTRNPPDVLFIPAHVIPFVLPIRRLPPSVVTIHDLGYHFYPETHTWQQRSYLQWSTRWNAFAAKRVIAISHATARDLQELYAVSANKIQVIYEGTRSLALAENAEATLKKFDCTRPYALFLGTIQPRKNLERVLRAYAQICEQVPWDLLLAGKPGWHSASLYELRESLKLGNRVRFLGYVSEQESSNLLSNALFFCFPSLFEGFGLPVLEAQAQGVAVITSNNSSIPEVAGNAAILVDPTDIDAIAQAMLQVSQDEALRQRLIVAGYANIKRFSWQKAARETLAALQEAMR